MLNTLQAQDISGIPSSRLVTLAMMKKIPFHKDPETRMLMFDFADLQHWKDGLFKPLNPDSRLLAQGRRSDKLSNNNAEDVQ